MQKIRFVILKFLLYGWIAAVLLMLQNTPGLFIILGTKPMLVAAFAVAVAMFEGEMAGAFFGAYGGMLCDLFSYYRSGYYALMLFFCCLAVGLLVQGFMRPVAVNCCLFTFAAMLITQSVAFFFLFLIRGYEGPEMFFMLQILPLCLYTAVMASPAFFGVRWLHGRFQKRILPEEKQETAPPPSND